MDAPVVDATRLHRAELPNGLRVLILEDRRLPHVDLGVSVPRGAGIEDPGEAGVAAFTAELMERGAGTRRALELAAVVDDLGASLDASSGWDASSVVVGGLSRDIDTLFDVLADVVLRPRFDADEAAKVRAESVARLRSAADDPQTLASWNLSRVLHPGHRYGRPVAGTPETVARLDAQAARAFHRRIYTPHGAIFYAVGDVDPAALLQRIRARFGTWQGPPLAAPVAPPAPPPARRVVLVDRPDLGQAQLAMGHEGIARTAPDRLAVQLMNTVLGGGGFSSRLMSEIRAKQGLTYNIGSGFGLRRRPGPFVVYSFTRLDALGRLIDGVLGELARIRREPPSARELTDAQSLRVGRFALALETSTAVISSLVDLDVYDLPRDSLDTYRGRVRALTPEDTASAARLRIHPERISIVVVGPAKKLRPVLEKYGTVEVVEP